MPKRIAILADTHVGLVGPQPSGRTYGDLAPVLQGAVDQIVGDAPDQAFLVGDIVNRGFGDEYIRAKRILSPLQRIFEPVLGNHELQRASVADFESQWGVRAVRITRFSDFPAIVLKKGLVRARPQRMLEDILAAVRQVERSEPIAVLFPPGMLGVDVV